MTTLEPGEHPLVAALQEAFRELIDGQLVDLVTGEAEDAIEMQADEWTLHLSGWPVQSAWVALDEEPSGEQERLLAVDAALAEEEVSALRDADHRLDGALVTALRGSHDPVSMALADVLAGESSVARSVMDDPEG